MAEHVRQVADLHGATPSLAEPEPELEVPQDVLAGHEELVHQDVPGTHRDPASLRQCSEAPLVLGPDLQVVIDDGHLAIEEEASVGRIILHEIEEVVEHLDEVHAKRLEG